MRDWLTTNGYPELGIFTFALRNKADARKWLMENGHPHLMAVINGIEGKAGPGLARTQWHECLETGGPRCRQRQ
ncbi:MAG: hypothetical protein IPJ85_07365 [Flavobacteriales bacterium]|nr:hypothetical protein [Flavobacteriales bacterium]